MQEGLLNIREAAEFLGLGERRVKELVDRGEIPAYKIGGTFLRFKKSQLAIFKVNISEKRPDDAAFAGAGDRAEEAAPTPDRYAAVKEFLYFNDFYILSVAVILIAVVLIIAT
jgi:excisionase family DNA binding protein